MTIRKKVLIIGGVVIACVVAAVAIGVSLPAATDYQAYSPLLGKPAPQITGTSLLTGASESLANLRGRYVVVNFFASWCTPCESEASDLEEFYYQESQAHLATIIGVVFEDVTSTASEFLRQTGTTYPAIADPGEKIAIEYGVTGPPSTYIINPQGIVVAHVNGPVTSSGLEAVINQLRHKRQTT